MVKEVGEDLELLGVPELSDRQRPSVDQNAAIAQITNEIRISPKKTKKLKNQKHSALSLN